MFVCFVFIDFFSFGTRDRAHNPSLVLFLNQSQCQRDFYNVYIFLTSGQEVRSDGEREETKKLQGGLEQCLVLPSHCLLPPLAIVTCSS